MGVVGVFNCQGAGWCKVEKKTRIHNADPGTLTGTISAHDVDSIAQLAGSDWDGQTIVYSYRSGKFSFHTKRVNADIRKGFKARFASYFLIMLRSLQERLFGCQRV